jgi:hypothetical protein
MRRRSLDSRSVDLLGPVVTVVWSALLQIWRSVPPNEKRIAIPLRAGTEGPGAARRKVVWRAKGALVDKIDSLVASHGAWMTQTHHGDGSKALLSYNFS